MSLSKVAAGLTEALTPVKRTHLAAVILPDDIKQLLRDIDPYVGYTSVVYCLKILPHVFTRPSELRLGRQNGSGFKKATWVIPASRMKRRREHVVAPLSRQGLPLLNELHAFTGNGDLVFPTARARVPPTSDATLGALLHMGYGNSPGRLGPKNPRCAEAFLQGGQIFFMLVQPLKKASPP